MSAGTIEVSIRLEKKFSGAVLLFVSGASLSAIDRFLEKISWRTMCRRCMVGNRRINECVVDMVETFRMKNFYIS